VLLALLQATAPFLLDLVLLALRRAELLAQRRHFLQRGLELFRIDFGMAARLFQFRDFRFQLCDETQIEWKQRGKALRRLCRCNLPEQNITMRRKFGAWALSDRVGTAPAEAALHLFITRNKMTQPKIIKNILKCQKWVQNYFLAFLDANARINTKTLLFLYSSFKVFILALQRFYGRFHCIFCGNKRHFYCFHRCFSDRLMHEYHSRLLVSEKLHEYRTKTCCMLHAYNNDLVAIAVNCINRICWAWFFDSAERSF